MGYLLLSLHHRFPPDIVEIVADQRLDGEDFAACLVPAIGHLIGRTRIFAAVVDFGQHRQCIDATQHRELPDA